jgi:hypothetical protein
MINSNSGGTVIRKRKSSETVTSLSETKISKYINLYYNKLTFNSLPDLSETALKYAIASAACEEIKEISYWGPVSLA